MIYWNEFSAIYIVMKTRNTKQLNLFLLYVYCTLGGSKEQHWNQAFPQPKFATLKRNLGGILFSFWGEKVHLNIYEF